MISNQKPKRNYIFQQFLTQKLETKQINILEEEGFCAKYDTQGEFLAIGCNNGTKHLYDLKENKIAQSIVCQEKIPITSLRWRPQIVSKSKVLLTGNSQGVLTHWHIPSGKKLFSLKEEENSILCLDYNKNGTHFATAGKDFNVRVYDESTKSVETKLSAAEWNCKGHSNRVFAVKFIDDNTLISGGWDSVIHIWDLREGKSIRNIYGPHLAGDALDYKDDMILTGSHSNKDQLQLWDFKSSKLLQTLEWTSKKQIPYIYTASFGKVDQDLIIAGASGTNEVKLFKNIGSSYKSLNKISNLGGGCFSVDFSSTQKQFVFTNAAGDLTFINYGVK